MPAYRKISGTWKAGVFWRKIAGTWKSGVMYRKVAGVWKVISGMVSAVADPNSVTGNGSGLSNEVVTSDPTTCTASNGIAPYTYAWSRVSGDATTAADSAAAATTTFSRFLTIGATANSVWKCTVTDSIGNVVDSNTVSVSLSNI